MRMSPQEQSLGEDALNHQLDKQVEAAVAMLREQGGRLIEDANDNANRQLRLEHADGLKEALARGLVIHNNTKDHPNDVWYFEIRSSSS